MKIINFIFILIIIVSCKKNHEEKPTKTTRTQVFEEHIIQKNKGIEYKTADDSLIDTPVRKSQTKFSISFDENSIISGTDSINLNYLERKCSRAELMSYLESSNPVLRFQSYFVLLGRNDNEYFKILTNHLTDSTILRINGGDVISEVSVIELMISHTQDRKPFSKRRKRFIMDYFLKNYPDSHITDDIIEEMNPETKYYEIIKKRIETRLKWKNKDINFYKACYALAKFKRRSDIPFLMDIFKKCERYYLPQVFRAIEVFPNKAFYKILESHFKVVIKKQYNFSDIKEYATALAVYNSKKSLAILEALTKEETYQEPYYLKDNREFIYAAIDTYNHPIYKKLHTKLKREIDPEVAKGYREDPFFRENYTWRL